MKKYIIVTGGQFANKGAQAMTYIAADEIATRWPNCKMLMYYDISKIRKPENYKFGFINDKGHFLIHSQSYKKVLQNTEAIIDISGYAVGSDWSERGNLFFIKNRLIDAKHYKIPVYLMPQSFGPFCFKGKLKPIVMMLLNHYLPYARVIMAREEEGREQLLNQFSLTNIIRTPDLVLQNKAINPNNIFVEDYTIKEKKLNSDKNVAIIPNSNNMRYVNDDKMYTLYEKVIRKLNELGYKVFLIYHSSEDSYICETLFQNNRNCNVELFNEDLDCLEFDRIVDQFDFVIASRYHSVVHAYRRRVPAIVLGWAVKYKELMEIVQQDRYLFDLRNQSDLNYVLDLIDDMNDHVEQNRDIIDVMMSEIQKNNVFDFVRLKSEL